MNPKEVIPEITDPMGQHWPQPKRENVLVYPDFAYVSSVGFESLSNYSGSIPTGTYDGKMWRRQINEHDCARDKKAKPEWLLCWYGPCEEEGKIAIFRRPLRIFDGMYQPLWLRYTNWKGENRVRRIIPGALFWGTSEPWHKEPQWILPALDYQSGERRDFALQACDFLSMLHGPVYEIRNAEGLVVARALPFDAKRSELKFQYRYELGTRIRFPRTLDAPDSGDAPAHIYAEAGEFGSITGYNEFEGYWAKTDRWPHPFGVRDSEFEPVGIEFKCPACGEKMEASARKKCESCGTEVSW